MSIFFPNSGMDNKSAEILRICWCRNTKILNDTTWYSKGMKLKLRVTLLKVEGLTIESQDRTWLYERKINVKKLMSPVQGASLKTQSPQHSQNMLKVRASNTGGKA